MDYCSSCRRTLNGALVCPGCGAYAPDIAPPGHRNTATTAMTDEAWPALEFPSSDERYERYSRLRLGAEPAGPDGSEDAADDVPVVTALPAIVSTVPTTVVAVPNAASPGADTTSRTGGPDATSDTGPSDGSERTGRSGDGSERTGSSGDGSEHTGSPDGWEHSAPAAEGRAARRRQLARWKKQRRRAAVASTVALVGGGLTLAVLPSRPSTGHDAQASSAPEPKATATTGTDAADTGSSVRPRTGEPRDSGIGAPSSAITSPPRKSTAVVSITAAKGQRQTGAAAGPGATTSARPGTPPVASGGTSTAGPGAPQTSTPPPSSPTSPPTGDHASDTPPPSPAPPTTPPDDRLCLLVLCVG
ncbi:hypothetical protein ACFYYH_23960 [Streptomyces sp. NPDC002018]|uniref:SCO2400 family protein n=1 Tax=Streptomyces sp. NPDC002018 TaxID=3364629 RepID=UPI0036807663